METQQAQEAPAGDQSGEVFQQDLENRESPVMQALRLLQLDVDFSRTVLRAAEDLGGQDARLAAAQVVCNLSGPQPGADQEQHKRLKLAEESYAWKVSSRPKATSAAYAGGKRHFKAWCDAHQQTMVLTNLKLEEYARFICLEERIGADKRSPSFKYCAGHILAVRDMRLEQIAAGLIKESEVTAPWKLATVSSFMAAKYAEEKQVLAENALNCYLVKRMTHEQLCRAMELALRHANRHWAVLIRFCLAWMCSAARRSSDMLGLLYRSMCVNEFRQATDSEPLIGIGPHPSRALAFVAGEGKTLESGQVEASACVRYFHWELCPVSAAADLIVCEFGGPRLRLATVDKGYVLRAPGSLGDKPLTASYFTQQMGEVLRKAGVSCDESPKGAAGKPTVCHNCKQYAINHAALVGVDYDEITHLASHERNITKNSYLTLCTDAIHRMAGFGRDWQHSHLLARGQVLVPNALREAVMPGLVGLLLELLSDPSAGRLLPALQAVSWLVDVFISDMPLKLRRYGKSWASLFPREVAQVTEHPEWAKFCVDIMVQDDLAKQRMKDNRDFKGNPVEGLTRILRPEADLAASVAAASCSVPTAQTVLTKKQSQATTTFDINGLETVQQALCLYNSIAGLEKKRWAGDTNKARMAFSKFGNGLAAEFKRRAQLLGWKTALDSLEVEKRALVVRKVSQLQSLASHYYKQYRVNLANAGRDS